MSNKKKKKPLDQAAGEMSTIEGQSIETAPASPEQLAEWVSIVEDKPRAGVPFAPGWSVPSGFPPGDIMNEGLASFMGIEDSGSTGAIHPRGPTGEGVEPSVNWSVPKGTPPGDAYHAVKDAIGQATAPAQPSVVINFGEDEAQKIVGDSTAYWNTDIAEEQMRNYVPPPKAKPAPVADDGAMSLLPPAPSIDGMSSEYEVTKDEWEGLVEPRMGAPSRGIMSDSGQQREDLIEQFNLHKSSMDEIPRTIQGRLVDYDYDDLRGISPKSQPKFLHHRRMAHHYAKLLRELDEAEANREEIPEELHGPWLDENEVIYAEEGERVIPKDKRESLEKEWEQLQTIAPGQEIGTEVMKRADSTGKAWTEVLIDMYAEKNPFMSRTAISNVVNRVAQKHLDAFIGSGGTKAGYKNWARDSMNNPGGYRGKEPKRPSYMSNPAIANQIKDIRDIQNDVKFAMKKERGKGYDRFVEQTADMEKTGQPMDNEVMEALKKSNYDGAMNVRQYANLRARQVFGARMGDGVATFDTAVNGLRANMESWVAQAIKQDARFRAEVNKAGGVKAWVNAEMQRTSLHTPVAPGWSSK